MSQKLQIRNFIVENFLYGQDDGFGEDVSLLEKGIIDSTGVLELVSFLEDRFAISVEDEELVPANFDSLSRLAAYVSKKMDNGK
jgi:acyl carrier protein